MDLIVENLVKAHRVLKKLGRPVTYVGGAVIPLYVEDPAAEQPRPTLDLRNFLKNPRALDCVAAHVSQKTRAEVLLERMKHIVEEYS